MALTQWNSIYGPICCCLHPCLHRCLPPTLVSLRCLSWPAVAETLEGITPEVLHQMRSMHVGQKGQAECGSPTLRFEYSCLCFILVVSGPFNHTANSRSYFGLTDEVWSYLQWMSKYILVCSSYKLYISNLIDYIVFRLNRRWVNKFIFWWIILQFLPLLLVFWSVMASLWT